MGHENLNIFNYMKSLLFTFPPDNSIIYRKGKSTKDGIISKCECSRVVEVIYNIKMPCSIFSSCPLICSAVLLNLCGSLVISKMNLGFPCGWAVGTWWGRGLNCARSCSLQLVVTENKPFMKHFIRWAGTKVWALLLNLPKEF